MTVDYKDIAKAWDSQKPSGRSNGKSFWLAVRIAIEKQIPKKMERYQCPDCRHYFEDGEPHKYCPCCGQRLGE